ncbi:MAG: hypothetical protein ABI831_05630 [Betaproteobacteria bacterium]
MSTKRNVYGEGNYQASRVYNKATRKFVDSGRVEEAARNAAPRSPAEAEDMKRAEQAGLLRAKEQGPAGEETGLQDSATADPDRSPAGKRDRETPRTPSSSRH